jgi:hypothetical protein
MEEQRGGVSGSSDRRAGDKKGGARERPQVVAEGGCSDPRRSLRNFCGDECGAVAVNKEQWGSPQLLRATAAEGRGNAQQKNDNVSPSLLAGQWTARFEESRRKMFASLN